MDSCFVLLLFLLFLGSQSALVRFHFLGQTFLWLNLENLVNPKIIFLKYILKAKQNKNKSREHQASPNMKLPCYPQWSTGPCSFSRLP